MMRVNVHGVPLKSTSELAILPYVDSTVRRVGQGELKGGGDAICREFSSLSYATVVGIIHQAICVFGLPPM
jgi:hypothetical protein